jgi:nucleotide-binding universal stress UspA family protein
MQHILVPTDFSSNAKNALDYALKLAGKLNSTVTIYHACQVPASSIHRPVPSIIQQEQQTIMLEARRKLKLICQKSRESGIECFTEISVAPVFDGIIEVSRQTGAGLIIMGTRGASGLSRWLFGSTTADVIQNSHIPVLAVPAKASYRLIERIIFATDYRDTDFDFINRLVYIASRFDSELSLLHVQTENGEFRSGALFESFREKIKSLFDYNRISFHLLENDNVVEAINNFSIKYGGDIISMATSRKPLFDRIFSKSMTKEMAYITKIPLLSFTA